MSSKNGKARKGKSAVKPAPGKNVPPPDVAGDDGEETPKESVVAALVARARKNWTLWHNKLGDAFATSIRKPRETHPVTAPEFAGMLACDEYRESGGNHVPGATALKSVTNLLEAVARVEGPCGEDRHRVAAVKGDHFLFLGDPKWRAVKFNAARWEVVPAAPVYFRRTATTATLPDPVRGGDVNELWRFVNVSAGDRVLVLAWMVQAVLPAGSYPVMALTGEQGSGKTTHGRLFQSLVDPNPTGLISPPRSEQDLFIAASNNHVLGFDNLSKIPQWLSDAVCRLATGGTVTTRTLYTTGGQTVFTATRPIILTSIADVAEQPDLQSRAVFIRLDPLGTGCMPEEQFWVEFEAARPRLLGALLDVICRSLAELPNVAALPTQTRMPGFVRLGVAVERAGGFKKGEFLAALARSEQEADAQALATYPVAHVLMRLVKDQRKKWEVTATTLLASLNRAALRNSKDQPHWPKAPNVLSAQLRRIAPVLRRRGLDLTFGRDGSEVNDKIITIRRL